MPGESSSEADLLTFIQSTHDMLEGPHHCWLNKLESRNFFDPDGIFLVLAGAFPDDDFILGYDYVIMFERAKLLQKRYPQLCVFGFQSGISVCTAAGQSHMLHTIMKEYISFPILLSNKKFSEMGSRQCYILFRGFRSALLCHEKTTDLGILSKAIEELSLVQNGNSEMAHSLRIAGVKKNEVFKEPYACSSLRNLFLYFPGCISADESGGRLFVSDSNHHRILIFDGNGRILDCIGSSPGFEDGEFETSKLLRPAASFYNGAEDCLYFVDSENHAIRRADLKRKSLETLYPTNSANRKISSFWSWILDKIGMGRVVASTSREFDPESLVYPWHLMQSSENDLLIINRSFETLWTMELASREIKAIAKGFPKIMEICGQMIMDKVSLLKQVPCHLLKQQLESNFSSEEGITYASLMSSMASFEDNLIFCDTVGQMVLKFDRVSGSMSNIKFSNFGILGLPYWMSSPLEKAFMGGLHMDHLDCFSVLPGKCDIRVNVDIPVNTELAAPLQEDCIWRQARGSAVEISGSHDIAVSSEKVGVAQQWFDELDNLAFSAPESELIFEDKNITVDRSFQEKKIHIDCAVNTSPGTSEVIISAVLYLKLDRAWNSSEDNREKKIARILEISNHENVEKLGRDACVQLMLESGRDPGDIIFMKPLHLRIRLECLDHLKPEKSKDVVLTDSSMEVNVSLN